MFALAEAVHQALEILVRDRFVKLRFGVVLQALCENFRPAGEVATQNATFSADLIGGEEKGHHYYADN
jgi:hypothetical protein